MSWLDQDDREIAVIQVTRCSNSTQKTITISKQMGHLSEKKNKKHNNALSQ